MTRAEAEKLLAPFRAQAKLSELLATLPKDSKEYAAAVLLNDHTSIETQKPTPVKPFRFREFCAEHGLVGPSALYVTSSAEAKAQMDKIKSVLPYREITPDARRRLLGWIKGWKAVASKYDMEFGVEAKTKSKPQHELARKAAVRLASAEKRKSMKGK